MLLFRLLITQLIFVNEISTIDDTLIREMYNIYIDIPTNQMQYIYEYQTTLVYLENCYVDEFYKKGMNK